MVSAKKIYSNMQSILGIKSSYPTSYDEPIHPLHWQRDHKIKMMPIGKDEVREYTIGEFEVLTSLNYLPHLAFDSQKTFNTIKGLTEKVVNSGGLSKRAEWLGYAYRNEVKKGAVNDVYIRWINNRLGFGLFANKAIEEGEYIGEYVGLVRPCTYYFSDVNEYCFRYPLYNLGFIVYTIDAQEYCNETSFINHSNDPNCDALVTLNNSILHVCVCASRDIAKDEQISYDYGNRLWKFPEA